jgi:hypothetical protein
VKNVEPQECILGGIGQFFVAVLTKRLAAVAFALPAAGYPYRMARCAFHIAEARLEISF